MERTMNIVRFRSLSAPARPSRPGRERGVVLFIALLVMVALSLAGIALIRSADTATIVSGNLAFKQAAEYAVDRSIEQAIDALFNPVPAPALPVPKIVNKTIDDPNQNYFACVQAAGGGCLPANTPIPEIPTLLKTKAAAAGLVAVVPVDGASNRSYYVIERMCLYDAVTDPIPFRLGQPSITTLGALGNPILAVNCNQSRPGLGADAGTQHYEGLTRTGDAFYRVTVRVDGPRNTVAYAQAILQ
jgi:hypothetical protein